MRRLPRRLQVALILTGGLLLISLVLQQQWTLRPSIINHHYFGYDVAREEPANPNQTCVLPRIHPFDPSIWAYIAEPRSIRCGNRHFDLIHIDEDGVLRFNQTQLASSGYDPSSLKCIWQSVLRKGDDEVLYGESHVLQEGEKVNYETIKVSCKNFAGVPIYSSLHVHVIPAKVDRPSSTVSSGILNVLIFGLDSMSRLSFIRLLPNTYRYLSEVMGMFIFRGMNKVADNTFPNLIAMLTGRKAYGPDLPDDSVGYDHWPLIWKNYSDSGYVTLWAEDFPDYGLFNYLSHGFHNPPTHHYLRPFWLAVRDSVLLRMSSHMCFGSTPKHLLQMDYVRRFLAKYHSLKFPYFGFSFLAELSHEYLSQVAAADQDFYQFFRFLNEGGYLDNTLLIVMSDHGHRFDPMRETLVGRIEERMPFFGMHVPEKVLSQDSKVLDHLKKNIGRLVTHYDTYSTLVDFLKHIRTGSPLGSQNSEFRRTLFGSIPSNRTCREANIPTHYCTCEVETLLPSDDPRSPIAAHSVIQHINAMLNAGGVSQQCAELRVGMVKSTHILTGENDPVDESGATFKGRVRSVVLAEPSKGVFEATVQMGEKEAHVMGDISRINKYSNQSSCIKHDILRKYCFCTLPAS